MRKVYSRSEMIQSSIKRLMGVCFMTFLTLSLSVTTAFGQERTISGVITSGEDGSTLPGVTVLVKGTTNGTITDIDGNYKISVPEDATLVVSFVGFKTQEFPVGTRSSIDVTLDIDISTLEEVVVVGYGTQKKSDLTGAVASISGDKLRGTVVTNMDQALQGRIAGVQVNQNSGAPGGAVSIRIRGTSSVSGGNEPLYVIDGIPIDGGGPTITGFDWSGGANGQNKVNPLAAINPNDIVSIEVLKDASATAIYGSRAANGVVMVTTRRGKSGEAMITYDGYYAFQSLPKKVDMMNLREYAEFQNSVSTEIDGINVNERFLDPSILGEGTDWQEEVFEVAPMQSHQMSFAGGNDAFTYALSGGYFSQDGIIIGSGFERVSMRLNVDAKVNEWAKVGTSISYADIDEVITLNDGGDGVIAQSLVMSPAVPVRDLDGNFAGPTANSAEIGANPVALALMRNNTLEREQLYANFFADLQLMKGLKFRTEYGISKNHSLNRAFHPTYQWGVLSNDVNSLNQSESTGDFWLVKNYFTYTLQSGIHDFTALLGQEAQKSTYRGSSFQKTGFVDENITTPNQGQNSANPIGGYQGANTLSSYYTRLNYILSDKYLFTVTGRYDGSSRFGPNNKYGFFPSASFAWRVMNEEFMPKSKVLSDLKLRLGYGEVGNQSIANYAYGSGLTTENTWIGTGSRNSRFANPDVKWEASRQMNLGVDVSLWAGRIDLTVDAYNRQSRDLLLELTSIPASIRGDIGAPYYNVGQMENKGIEISLNTRNIEANKFSWTTDIAYTLNRNKVLNIDQPYTQNLYWYAGFQTVTRTTSGNPIGSFYGYQTDGIFTDAEDIRNSPTQVDDQSIEGNQNLIHQRDGVWIGDQKFKDLNGDGVIDVNDQTSIGNPNPKFTGGINNTFSYAGLTLNVYFTGSYGGKILNFQRVRNEGMSSLNNNQAATVVNRARVEFINPDDPDADMTNPDDIRLANPGTDIPRFSPTDNNTNDRMSDRWIEDGSYLRLQNVSLSYQLPKGMLNKVKVSSMRVYVNAQNLYTFTNYTGLDPEIGAFNQNALLQNVDMGRYPSPRVVTLGTSITF